MIRSLERSLRDLLLSSNSVCKIASLSCDLCLHQSPPERLGTVDFVSGDCAKLFHHLLAIRSRHLIVKAVPPAFRHRTRSDSVIQSLPFGPHEHDATLSALKKCDASPCLLAARPHIENQLQDHTQRSQREACRGRYISETKDEHNVNSMKIDSVLKCRDVAVAHLPQTAALLSRLSRMA